MNIVTEIIEKPFVVQQSLAVKCILSFFIAASFGIWDGQNASWSTLPIWVCSVILLVNAFFYRVEITSQVIRKRSLLGIRTVHLSDVESLRAYVPRSPTARSDGIVLIFQKSPLQYRWYSRNFILLLHVDLMKFDLIQGKQVIQRLVQSYHTDKKSLSECQFFLDLLTTLIDSRRSWNTRLVHWGKLFLLVIGLFAVIWILDSFGLLK